MPTPPARIGRTVADSTPAYTPIPRPPDGAPNVLVVMLDDLGFGQLGCFGSDIGTPAIDGLAADGLRYGNFHVTALCSPTRACTLTGRNHHAVGMGFLTDVPIGFPGYTGRIPRSAGTLPRILRDQGYSTFAVGKWHLTPRWEQSASGPFDLWPLGLGFERYYGFLAGDTNQFAPDLVRDNSFIEAPARPEDGYHVTEDLADQAIRLIADQQHATPGKPWFCYFAPGATHAPHQAPREWIDRFRGRFDRGWDAWRDEVVARQLELGVLPSGTTVSDRPSWVPAWEECSADQRRLYARMMEVFAGFLAHTDAQLGRVLDHLRLTGQLDDTVVLVLSDNGASAEGGPIGSFNEHRFTHNRMDDEADTIARIDELGGHRAYNHYAWGWAWAGNAPFRLWKRYTWLGGVRTPLVVHWPTGIDASQRGAVRDQFCHAIDLMPTVLEAAGIDAPDEIDGVAQQRIDGASLTATFGDAEAPAPRDTQYFELLGSRAIYHDGWKATTDHVGTQIEIESELVEGSRDLDADHWALFDLRTDPAETTDVGVEHPDVLARLTELWWAEAGANQVLPLDDSFIGRASALEPSPWPAGSAQTYRPGFGAVAEDLLPPMGGGFRLVADLTVTGDGAPDGVLVALGDWSNGYAVYLLDGVPTCCVNLFGDPVLVRSDAGALTAGDHTVEVVFERDPAGGGPLALLVDDLPAGQGVLPFDLPFRWQIGGGGFLLGRDVGFPVCDDYTPPFPLRGAALHEVRLETASAIPRALRDLLRDELHTE